MNENNDAWRLMNNDSYRYVRKTGDREYEVVELMKEPGNAYCPASTVIDLNGYDDDEVRGYLDFLGYAGKDVADIFPEDTDLYLADAIWQCVKDDVYKEGVPAKKVDAVEWIESYVGVNDGATVSDEDEDVGRLIDVVEDWLDAKATGGDTEITDSNGAFIKGKDYDEIAAKFREIVRSLKKPQQANDKMHDVHLRMEEVVAYDESIVVDDAEMDKLKMGNNPFYSDLYVAEKDGCAIVSYGYSAIDPKTGKTIADYM